VYLGIKRLLAFGDSRVVIEQVNKEWDCVKDTMDAYCAEIRKLRDWFFVNKKYCTKGLGWSTIPVRNTKRLDFCEQNLQETDQFKTFWRSHNFSRWCCLAESRYQTSLNSIQMITVT
jgi:ribonuclease HI